MGFIAKLVFTLALFSGIVWVWALTHPTAPYIVMMRETVLPSRPAEVDVVQVRNIERTESRFTANSTLEEDFKGFTVEVDQAIGEAATIESRLLDKPVKLQ